MSFKAIQGEGRVLQEANLNELIRSDNTANPPGGARNEDDETTGPASLQGGVLPLTLDPAIKPHLS